jgi:hypothetical protein
MKPIEHLNACIWTHPKDYGGFSPDGDFCILSQNRDSSLIDRHNWQTACDQLHAEAYDDGHYGELAADRPMVYHWRAGHWACGWVEYLMVRADAPDDIKNAAGEILRKLEGYPILDEDGYSEAKLSEACKYWANCSVKERLEYLQRAELSIFAARHDWLPDDPTGALFEMIRPD